MDIFKGIIYSFWRLGIWFSCYSKLLLSQAGLQDPSLGKKQVLQVLCPWGYALILSWEEKGKNGKGNRDKENPFFISPDKDCLLDQA